MIKSGYKKTEIGEIPDKWESKNLGSILESIFYGITARSTKENTGIKFLRTTDIRDFNFTPSNLPFCKITEDKTNLSKYFLKKGDIIVARAGTVGISVVVKEDLDNIIFGSYLIKLIFKTGKVDTNFVHYFFQSRFYWNKIYSAQGSTIKNINIPFLKSIIIPVPNLIEQQKIAKILSDTDALIESLDQLITKKKRIKEGLMHELLTMGIGHTKFKDTIIGMIPDEWVLLSLKESCELIKDGTHTPPTRIRSGIPLLSAINIENGKIEFHNNVTYIDEKDYKQINKFYSIKKGDVLITIVGTLGRLALVISDRKFSIQRSVAILRPYHNIVNNKYLFYTLNSIKSQKQIIFYSKSTAQIGIYLGGLFKIIIPIPPLPEQQKIAKILSDVDKEIEALQQKKEKFKMIKEGLMQQLLTGKVRVK